MKPYYQDDAVTIYHGCKDMRPVIDCNYEKTYFHHRGGASTPLSAKTQGCQGSKVKAWAEKRFQAVSRAYQEKKKVRRGSSKLERQQDNSQGRSNPCYSFISPSRTLYRLREQEIGASSH